MRKANLSIVIGLLIGIVSIITAIATEVTGSQAAVFLHPVGLIVVFGGILGSALISSPSKETYRILRRTYFTITRPKDDFMPVFKEAVAFSIGINRDSMYLENNLDTVKNAMLKDGLSLILMGYKQDDIRRFLEIKQEENESSLGQCSVFYFGLAKMGPAFGLIGTLVGLIILLYFNMSTGNMDKVASSMGIALTATLYGVMFANLFFSPLADYMQYSAEMVMKQDSLVIEAIMQIKDRKHPVYLAQALKCYLPRDDYREIDTIMNTELLRQESPGTNAQKGQNSGKAA
ncbi:MAG: MotA/TolQ/ExbB proton channel family protein [Pseudomonadota bacterium]